MEMNILDKIPNKYIFEQDRLETFEERKWKTLRGYKNCTPEKFAAAGFFYFGSNDVVVCFCCLRQLGDWEKHDDPWEEHIKRGGDCYFVQLKLKGECINVMELMKLYCEMKKNHLILCIDKKIDYVQSRKEQVLSLISKKNKRGRNK